MTQHIRLGGNEYGGTIISVMQMCKKSEGKTCASKHIVDEMWKQWWIKGGKEKGKENDEDEEETLLAKTDSKKTQGKGKKDSKADPKDPKKKVS